MKHDALPIEIHLPTLSDEASVAIRDFLIKCQLSFESRYYPQIQRFRRDRECNDDDQADCGMIPTNRRRPQHYALVQITHWFKLRIVR